MKIFQIGLGEDALSFLENGPFVVKTEKDVTDWNRLLEAVRYAECDVVVLNMDVWNLSTIRFLRSHGILTPVLGIGFEKDFGSWSEHRAEFLENGGDDFIRSPPHLRELAASLHAVTRRSRGATALEEYEFRYGKAVVEINVSAQIVGVNGKTVKLSPKEMRLLSELATARGRVLSRDKLMDSLYAPTDDEPGAKIVDVFISRLRKKLAEAHPLASKIVHTVDGYGYKLVTDDEPQLTKVA